jgi:hypothetical protein
VFASPFDYLLILAAVILGLAVTDVAVSLQRLLAAGARVKWDWLSPGLALVALLKIVTLWWSWYVVGPIARGVTFEMYLAEIGATVILFLMAASALPDEVGEGGVDLAAFFETSRRRYWTLFLAHWLAATAVSIWIQVALAHRVFDPMTPVWLVIPAVASLIVVKNRWWQTVGVAGFATLYLFEGLGRTLGSG